MHVCDIAGGPALALCRARPPRVGTSNLTCTCYLTLTLQSSPPDPQTLKQLEKEHALAAHLHADWALRPLEFRCSNAWTTLLLEDPGGHTLDRELGRPLDISRFLKLEIAMR